MRILLSWSSGKDSAWALHALRADPDVEVVGLLTTVTEAYDRVAMHGVRRALLAAQAAAVGLPLHEVWLPSPCPNEVYEARMGEALATARAEGVEAVAFGDLFLEDIRDYRESRMAPTGLAALFPLWGRDTAALSRQMVGQGLRATLTSVDPRQLDPAFVGRHYDAALLDELPAGVDPCGERGEFHTVVWASPDFSAPLPVRTGERVEREGFWFADVLLADGSEVGSESESEVETEAETEAESETEVGLEVGSESESEAKATAKEERP